ncbi:MAG: XRE family transcriptional regulator [Caldilineaceae bacterium]
MKGKLLQEVLDTFSEEEKTQVKVRAQELRQQYLTLQDLRKAHDLTQERLAEILHIKQENVSRIEKRSDLLLSTLRSYIEAMGGNLKLIVEFPDRPPVALTGFGELTSSAMRQEQSVIHQE